MIVMVWALLIGEGPGSKASEPPTRGLYQDWVGRIMTMGSTLPSECSDVLVCCIVLEPPRMGTFYSGMAIF
jgi:hypothetical protein